MRVMVLGSGGREHCIAWKIAQNPEVKELFCVPGNGGMSTFATCVSLSSIEDILCFAQEKSIDLTIVGPESPLSLGIVDAFLEKRKAIIGPDRRGTLLESSKVFAKEFMKRYGIPTAPFTVFDSKEEALEVLRKRHDFPVVIKADGLASGKGVYIAWDFDEALLAVFELMVDRKFGTSGERIVIEEYLEGEEATVMVLFDGRSYRFLPSSQDHKKVGEGDIGPNTGGMGAYSPTPVVSEEILGADKTPWVLEFNARLGDPEAQAVLPRIRNDWLEVNMAIWEGNLHKVNLEVLNETALCVVLASRGYPGHFERGKRIEGLESFTNLFEDDVFLFHAGTERKEDGWYTAGGRVLNVCALGEDLYRAYERAYAAVSRIRFEGMYYRRDIGFRVLKRKGP